MEQPTTAETKDQQALLLYFLYRLVIGLALFAVIQSGHGMQVLAESNPRLFQWIGYGYLALAVLSGLFLRYQWFSASTQTQLMFMVDAISIPALMYTGAGITSGMGTLLAVSIALTSLVLPGTLVLFFAAFATFGIFSQLLLTHGFEQLTPSHIAHAGLLGAAFFFIAALSGYLSHRARVSESLALKQAADLADLARLNQLIIQQMATGVVVANDQGKITYINDSARRLMRVPIDTPAHSLNTIIPELYDCLKKWCKDKSTVNKFTISTGRTQLRAHIKESGLGQIKAPLIFLEDASEVIKQAQQIKLASLGRLTASIAHQIRNPLSSISHAGQLLAESPSITESDKRLTEIIRANTVRVNEIIESILQLSKRQTSTKEPLELATWLPLFIERFRHQENLSTNTITLTAPQQNSDGRIMVDPVQIEQVLSNLCHNAKSHFNGHPDNLRIRLRWETNSRRENILDVIDNGQGFSDESREQLFEPFYTTRSNGTGLGLYIAKELSEANGIELSLIPNSSGAHFRLRFTNQ